MKKVKLLASSICLMLATGCNGTLYTVENDANGNETKKPGVTVYHLTTIKEVYETRKLVKEDKVIGSADGTIGEQCLPQQIEKIVIGTDLDRPYQLVYEPGFLEANKFGAELSAQGSLMSVNTESSPDRGETLTNLASVATSLVPLALGAGPAEAAAPDVKLCNAEERLIGRYRVPSLQPTNAAPGS